MDTTKPMTSAYMAKVCDAAIQAMQANGLTARTIRLQEVRDQLRLAALTPVGNAGAVDDAMVERAEAAREKFWETDANYPPTEAEFDADPAKYDKLAMRAALTAALAPAAATPEHTFPGDTCKACHPELAAPADQPAAGDDDMANVGRSLMETLRRNCPEYSWNDSPAEIVVDLLNDKHEAIAERDRESARLDYIERTFSGMTNRERYLPVAMVWGSGAMGRTLREACDKYMNRDAAIAAGGEEKSE